MEVKVPEGPRYQCKQGGTEGVPKLPARAIVVAPGGAGKTVILVNLLTRPEAWRGCFERIWVVSPTINLDRTWDTLKDYQKNVMKVDPKEQTYWESWDEGAMQTILDRLMRISELQKDRNLKKLYACCLIADDIADSPEITRQSRALQTCFVRMRHAMLTTVVSVQKYRVLAPLIRVNATDLIVGNIRSMQDLAAIAEECSAQTGGKEGFYALYEEATKEPYSFLNIKLADPNPRNRFWLRFSKRLELMDSDSDKQKARKGGA
jgi:hypothetical protein